MCNRVSCNRTAFRLGATSYWTIEGLPRYSAGIGEIYALDRIFPTLFAFRVKALHQVSGSWLFSSLSEENRQAL